MLNRCEDDVMCAVYNLCDGTDGCLISVPDIISVLPSKRSYSKERIDDALNFLKAEGYIDVISSARKGERMYVISMKESGMTYRRNAQRHRQDIVYKIFLALVGATATFVFGLVLKAVFRQ